MTESKQLYRFPVNGCGSVPFRYKESSNPIILWKLLTKTASDQVRTHDNLSNTTNKNNIFYQTQKPSIVSKGAVKRTNSHPIVLEHSFDTERSLTISARGYRKTTCQTPKSWKKETASERKIKKVLKKKRTWNQSCPKPNRTREYNSRWYEVYKQKRMDYSHIKENNKTR